MNKAYKTKLLDLRLCDCMDLMVDMQDKEFDLAITSPPYNMNLRVNHKGDGYCSRQIVDELSTKYHGYDDNLPMEEYEEFIDSVLAELIRVSEIVFFNIQMITGNKPALFKLIGKYSDLIKEVAIWDKGHAQPAIGKGCMNSRYEFVIIFGGRPITRSFDCANFKRGGLDNLWEIKKERSKVDGHGASYPVSLVNHILDNFGEKGQRVIDPFLGTFTTAIACHHKGFRLTGSEVNQNYYKLGVDRVKRETAQMELI